ncbi:MAG: alanine racemase [Anaerolineaceae bacterium]|nr:alanine racemase [Anaerolineaceae bacterium]
MMQKHEIPTPALIVDFEKLTSNITEMAERAKKAGRNLRPHIKTHKTPFIAHMQINSGAIGIACAKLGEAEVMAASGIEDIFIAYPVVGADKVDRLLNLARWVPKISTSLDTYTAMRALNKAAVDRGQVLDVIVEIEAGYKRTGVETGEPLLKFVKEIIESPGLNYKGFMYMAGGIGTNLDPEIQRKAEVAGSKVAAVAAAYLKKFGIDTQVIGGGSTPGAKFMEYLDEAVNEYRPGCYVFGDLRYADLGAHTREQISLTVLATVVSIPDVPHPDRIVTDAGSKSLTHMPGSVTPGYGTVVQYPDFHISSPSEEHGVIYGIPAGTRMPEIGSKVDIWPNYVSDTVNYFDKMWVVQGDEVIATWDILARGKSV